MNDPSLPGRPDFVFRTKRLVVFVDGCFWHGCPICQKASKSNTSFWTQKVATNRRRDIRVARKMRRMGWSVIRIRECELKCRVRASRIVSKLKNRLR